MLAQIPTDSFISGIPLIETPGFDNFVDQLDWTDNEKRAALDLYNDGFAVISFPEPEFDMWADKCIARLTQEIDQDHWKTHKSGQRLSHAWKYCDEVVKIACHANVIDILSKLYGREAFPFQTLNFAYGSQQHYHSDSVHFSSIPERFMCGVWVALEDVGPDQGPLVYYPGSHKWPILYNDLIGFKTSQSESQAYQDKYHDAWQTLIAKTQIEPKYFHARKGDMLIWAANLLHGGSLHQDIDKTRWSQVTHYYFKGCSYTTPMRSDPQMGNLYLRQVNDIRTGEAVHNEYIGEQAEKVRERFGAGNRPNFSDFDPNRYLELNPDLNKPGLDLYRHFLTAGISEGRRYR